MRKLLIVMLALVTAMIPLTCSAGAVLEETNAETGYKLVIRDDAGLLGEDAPEVMEAMRPLLEYANVGFLSYPASGGSTAAGAAKAKEWGSSVFGSGTRFTVFIIDMKTRHLDIYASEKLSGVLTAAEENSITDNVYRYASRGDYTNCAVETFEQIEKVLKGEKIATPMKYVSNALLALIVSILAVYLLISGWIRKEQAVSMPVVVKAAAAGAATVITANHLKKVVHHESSSGGHGGHGGGGGFGGGGGGGSSGGHGF